MNLRRISTAACAAMTITLGGCGMVPDLRTPEQPAAPAATTASEASAPHRLTKKQACAQANSGFEAFLQAMLDAAPPTTPGQQPSYSPTLLARVHQTAERFSGNIETTATQVKDPHFAAALRTLAQAVAAYITVNDLSSATAEGTALTEATNELGVQCKKVPGTPS